MTLIVLLVLRLTGQYYLGDSTQTQRSELYRPIYYQRETA